MRILVIFAQPGEKLISLICFCGRNVNAQGVDAIVACSGLNISLILRSTDINGCFFRITTDVNEMRCYFNKTEILESRLLHSDSS